MKHKTILVFKSKTKLYYKILFNTLSLIGFIYLVNIKKEVKYLVIIGALGIALYFFVSNLKKANIPVIKISNDGIKIQEGFFKWDEIQNETIIADISGRYKHHYLVFQKKTTSEKFKVFVDDLDVDLPWLSNRIALYREAFEMNKYYSNKIKVEAFE